MKIMNLKSSLTFVIHIFHKGTVVSDVVTISRNGIEVTEDADTRAPSPGKIRKRRISKPSLTE